MFDQTVREIKREVNLKVLKVPEIEQKVLDATDDEPWGPHGSVLAEIAQATKKFSECQMVMNVLWTRLGETGRNWRFVYKALAVIEYLVANGSERAVDDIIEHTFQISSLSSFEYVEPNGKDNGINVRKKVENIVALLNDKDKIQEARNKAAANRDKYFGLSSTGITYKSGSGSGSGSLSSGSSLSGDRYGGFGSKNDGEAFRDSYKESDRSGEDKFDKSTSKSRHGVAGSNENSSKKGSSRHGSKSQDSSATDVSKPNVKTTDSDKYATLSSQNLNTPSNNNEDDFDDFDPRGTSRSKAAPASSPPVDLFGDLMDAPVSVATEKSFGNSISEEVDLFADASFVSAPSRVESVGDNQSESKVDLFASQPAVASAASPAVDFFAAPDTIAQAEYKASESAPITMKAFDPFAAVPMNNFDTSDPFGAFTSPTDSSFSETTPSSINNGSPNNLNEKTSAVSNPPPKKDAFQVKSGIWADSLSRGLIDLNISAPKKVNLADVGVVGGLTDGSEEKEKGPPTSFYMGRAMGSGSGLGKSSGFTSTSSSATDLDDFFSNISSQNQFGSFQK